MQNPANGDVLIPPNESRLVSYTHCDPSRTRYHYQPNFTRDDGPTPHARTDVHPNRTLIYREEGFAYTVWKFLSPNDSFCHEILIRIWNGPHDNFKRLRIGLSLIERLGNRTRTLRADYFHITLLESPPSVTPCQVLPAATPVHSETPRRTTHLPTETPTPNPTVSITAAVSSELPVSSTVVIVVVAVSIAAVVLCIMIGIVVALTRRRKTETVTGGENSKDLDPDA